MTARAFTFFMFFLSFFTVGTILIPTVNLIFLVLFFAYCGVSRRICSVSVYKEPRVTNAFAGIHSTRNRIFCLPADRTEYGSIIVRSDPVIAAPAILFLAESETVMNRSAARGVDFPFAVSWRSHSGACPFGRTREFPRQYAIRLSKSGGEKYAFTSIGKIIGASEPVLRRSRKISPHPVFHTFLAFDHLKIALFTKSLQFTRGLSCKKKE